MCTAPLSREASGDGIQCDSHPPHVQYRTCRPDFAASCQAVERLIDESVVRHRCLASSRKSSYLNLHDPFAGPREGEPTSQPSAVRIFERFPPYACTHSFPRGSAAYFGRGQGGLTSPPPATFSGSRARSKKSSDTVVRGRCHGC
jgi:hypothetical protein